MSASPEGSRAPARPRRAWPLACPALALLLALSASAHLLPARARACSGWSPATGPRPGAVVFGEGAELWVFSTAQTWLRVDAAGAAHEVPARSEESRVVDEGRRLVLVAGGVMHPSCEREWHRVDVVDTARLTRRGGPRLRDVTTVLGFAVSPSGARAAVLHADGVRWLDLADLRAGGSVPLFAEQVAWLDDARLAVLQEDALVVLDVTSGARRSVPLEPAERDARRLADEDASPSGVTLIERDEDGLATALVRVDLGAAGATAPTRLALAAPRAVLAISRGGDRVALRAEGAVVLVDRTSGAEVGRVRTSRPVVAAAFAPDGARVAVSTRARPVAPDPDGMNDWELWEGGRGEVTVEVFELPSGVRRSWGPGRPSTLSLARPRRRSP